MENEFLTMCDTKFLPQVLVLQRSLKTHARGSYLRVLCADEQTQKILAALSLPRVSAIPLATLELNDPQLRPTRSDRSDYEYFWTLIPAFCWHVMQRQRSQGLLTWVDADVAFFQDPEILTSELGDASILLVPHRYRPPYARSLAAGEWTIGYGKYNAGLVSFRRDALGEQALMRWRHETIAWCYDRLEPGKFSNQKHLEVIARSDGTQEARRIGIGLGPWSAGRYRISIDGETVMADGEPIVAYHFQSLRLRRAGYDQGILYPSNYLRVRRGRHPIVGRLSYLYRVTRDEHRLLWAPYAAQLRDAIADIEQVDPAYRTRLQAVHPWQLFGDLREKSRLTLDTMLASIGRRFAGEPKADAPG